LISEREIKRRTLKSGSVYHWAKPVKPWSLCDLCGSARDIFFYLARYARGRGGAEGV
jgi:hypothetical protein